MSIRKGCLEGGLACVVKDWVGFQETERRKMGCGEVVEAA